MKDSRVLIHDNYHVSRFELEHLARLWWHEYLDVHFYCYVVNQSGSYELFLGGVASERLREIEKELGEEAFEALRVESYKSFKWAEVYPDHWREFTKEESK